jgi:ribosome-associated toxin RatA of RatAB toxin-antitoxin module
MSTINKKAEVPYAVEEMYNLVNTIEDYPRFVPWCHSTEVHKRDEDEVRATMTFARGGLQKSFSTCNRLQPHKMIELRLLDGPFRHLEGFWRFEHRPENKGTLIKFDLEYEFANHFFSLAFGPVFNQVANMLVDVFCKRADEVYGR